MIEFTVNDRLTRTASDPTMPLTALLLNELRLTGAKLGCDDGRCGACTVLVSCSLLADRDRHGAWD